ncbi:MAG: hypothetical protein ACSHW0_04660 [Thalassotalea sp.]
MQKHKKIKCLFCLFVVSAMAFITVKAAAVQAPLVFTQTYLGENFLCAQNALKIAYAELDREVTFLTLPSKRALKYANEGKADGEMIRVHGVEKDYPNLVKIPVPICEVDSVMIANEKVNISTYEDIKKYRLGITIGFVDHENLVKQYNIKAVKVVKNEILIKMILRDRVDVIFLTKSDAEKLIKSSKKVNLKILAGLSRQLFLYHYLHKNHQTLIPKITEQLTLMQLNKQLNLSDIKSNQ